MPLLPIFLLAHALAQDATVPLQDPGVVPAAGIAMEGGPGALWVAPANLAYDPDQRWGLFYRYAPDSPYHHSGAATYGIGGFSAGLRWLQHEQRGPDFSVDLGLGIRLPKRVAVGGALRWSLLRERENFVAFDLGVAWRPLPWFGLGVVTRNIGDPGGAELALPQTGAGIAVRPLGDMLVVGVDYLYTPDTADPHKAALNARIRPTRGLFVRANLDSTLAFGAGVEVYLGGVGTGVFLGTTDLQGLPDVTAWIGSDERDEHIAPPRSVTVLDLLQTPAYLPERRLFGKDDESWFDVLEHFRLAAETPGVQGMLVTLGDAELSWARWTELRDAIRRLKVDGKDVTVLLSGNPGNGAVYAASAASRVLVHPAATVGLTGVSTESFYVRGLLDMLGVDVQVVRRAGYKSAAETLTEVEPSAEDREQDEALLDTLHETLVAALSEGRGRTREDVQRWIDGGPWSAAEAVAMGLADGRAYPDQARGRLDEFLEGKVRVVDLAERRPSRSPWEAPLQIAVVYVEGTIVTGVSRSSGLLSGARAGSTTISEQLEAAAEDVKTRAVVLRVDSPGGSAFASDEIWRAVQRVQAAGKPVVVSMGGVAASGGYYIAAGADAIWAEPTTITGSIGVLGLKPSAGDLLGRFGITSSRTARGRNATMDSIAVPWDPLQQARMQSLIDTTYDMFKERVATGRELDPQAVEAAAQGRVWSGADAVEVGLVDELGGLTDAIAHARRLAGILPKRAVEVVGLRPKRSLAELLLPDLSLLRSRTRWQRIGMALEGGTLADLAQGPLAPLGQAALLASEADTFLWMLDPSLPVVEVR